MYQSQLKDCPWLEPIYTQLLHSYAGDRLHHALLFCGPQGVGKHLLTSELTKLLLCTNANPPKPCGQCKGCAMQESGNHPDLLLLPETTTKSISVDTVRQIIKQLQLHSHQGKYRVLLLPELDAMTTQAANALLKCLEEPPANTFFICTTTSPGQLPATVRSRMQQFAVPLPERERGIDYVVTHHQLTRSNAAVLLDQALGAPLHVEALLNSQYKEMRHQLKNMLMMAQSGLPSSMHTVIKNLEAFPLADCVHIMLGWLTDMLYLRMGAKHCHSQNTNEQDLLQEYAAQIDYTLAFALYDRLVVLTRSQHNNIALHKASQLFALGYAWAQLFAARGKAA